MRRYISLLNKRKNESKQFYFVAFVFAGILEACIIYVKTCLLRDDEYDFRLCNY